MPPDAELSGSQIAGLDRALERATSLIDTALALLESNRAADDLAARFVLAPGLERLMKITLLLGHRYRDRTLTDTDLRRDHGHDLLSLRDGLVALAETTPRFQAPALQADLTFVRDDPLLGKLLEVLTSYGTGGRYAEFKLLTGEQPTEEPDAMWDEIEVDELLGHANLNEVDLSQPELIRHLVMQRIDPAIRRLLRFVARLWAFEGLGKLGVTWSVQLAATFTTEARTSRPSHSCRRRGHRSHQTQTRRRGGSV